MSPDIAPLEYGVEPPGYRLPPAAHIGRVVLQVADLDRSIAYYETVIGLCVRDRSGDMATLGAAGDDSVLVELRHKPGVQPVSRRGRIGLYHFAILLPTRAALGQFLVHLTGLGVYAGMSDHFVSEALYLTDPDGLGIEVYADRPRSEWKFADRQLTMATEPLNARAVIAEAAGVRWTGAPAGTVIGHVHLYVRDLAETERFYHEALGFDKTVWNYPGALFLSAGGYHHHLGTNTWAAEAPLATDDDARLVEWEIILPYAAAVDSAAASLQGAGFAVTREGRDLLARDPWGTQVRVRTRL